MLDSVAAFFGMGGYAFFVWGSYGAVAAVLVQQFAAPVLRRRRLLRELAEEDGGAATAADDRARARLTDCGRDTTPVTPAVLKAGGTRDGASP